MEHVTSGQLSTATRPAACPARLVPAGARRKPDEETRDIPFFLLPPANRPSHTELSSPRQRPGQPILRPKTPPPKPLFRENRGTTTAAVHAGAAVPFRLQRTTSPLPTAAANHPWRRFSFSAPRFQPVQLLHARPPPSTSTPPSLLFGAEYFSQPRLNRLFFCFLSPSL